MSLEAIEAVDLGEESSHEDITTEASTAAQDAALLSETPVDEDEVVIPGELDVLFGENETAVFEGKDEDADFNDWPTYELTEAVVMHPKSGQLTSLLEADTMIPLTVTGRLAEVTPKFSKHLLRPEAEVVGQFITLHKVMTYCYASHKKDGATIWAGAKSGGFEIQPADSYKEIHQQSVEDVKLLCFVQNYYSFNKHRGKRGSVTLDDIDRPE
ncbi:MAG: hypothetical protein M1816_007116 [Peltula sp. TS41687]|nr:MAG: hypothetical protein M1816_007116 [Peltula sp. TS41687]